MAKNPNVFIEIKDGVKADEAMQAVLNALKEIDTKVEVLDGNRLQWDISKNAPGYQVLMRDEGIGEPMKFVVGKAPRSRKSKTV